MLAPVAPAPTLTTSAVRGSESLTTGSVERPAQSLLLGALVVLDAGVARPPGLALVPQQPRHRGQRAHVRPAPPIPEAGALEGLGTVEEAFLHLHPDRHLRLLALNGEPLQELGVAHERGPPVDPKGVFAARDQEDQADVRVLHDVGEAVDTVVAGT